MTMGHLYDTIGDTVQKVTVMGNEKEASSIVPESLL